MARKRARAPITRDSQDTGLFDMLMEYMKQVHNRSAAGVRQSSRFLGERGLARRCDRRRRRRSIGPPL